MMLSEFWGGEAWILTSAFKHMGGENGQSMDVVPVHTRPWESANFRCSSKKFQILTAAGLVVGSLPHNLIRQDAEL